jgi:hypothetical protein
LVRLLCVRVACTNGPHKRPPHMNLLIICPLVSDSRYPVCSNRKKAIMVKLRRHACHGR